MILVTGANGFVGSALCKRLNRDRWSVRAFVRSQRQSAGDFETVVVGDLADKIDWSVALKDVEFVVHLAARVHVMKDQSSDPLAEFRRVNVEGTANLARCAAAAGVRRFIYLSSIKVNGESTQPDRAFTAADAPAPEDDYGVSKLEAEQALRQVAARTGMEVVIIRPPLVYGPGVKANFESMMRWIVSGAPLPLAAVTNNRRSLVAIDNLVDLIVTCLTHRAAANQTFLVSDGEDLSTAELLMRMGRALGKPVRIFYAPISLLKLGAVLFKKNGAYRRLCGSLQVDTNYTQRLLNWVPPLSVDEGLRRTAEGFRS